MNQASMPPLDSEDRQRLADRLAEAILDGFSGYTKAFKALTQEAKAWFEQQAWKEAQTGANRRLDLYAEAVRAVKAKAILVLTAHLSDRAVWMDAKIRYARLISDRNDEELAETFFNSVTRAALVTVGVDPKIEFVWFDIEVLPSGDELPTYQSFHRLSDTRGVVREILDKYTFTMPWAHPDRDAEAAAKAIDRAVSSVWTYAHFDAIELAEPIFYRNKGAYLVGRIRRSFRVIPVVLALVSRPEGICVDAVITDENEASVVFSFTRSYFFVDAVRPIELIGFLRTLFPWKPVAEMYISLGFVKHGKSVRYRHLKRHLRYSNDRFEHARGIPGMVMICFTLPSYDLVFKVIRDRFAYPKQTTRADVVKSYELIFKNDRVGRLVDAQAFEHLSFEKERFAPALLEELTEQAKDAVHLEGDRVILRYVYTERRLDPLNLYVEEVGFEKAKAAVIDFGQAIKDLAAVNIFAGDLLTKNFGVTRQGRVVFYDYDEVCPLEQCRFRKLPVGHDSFNASAEQVSFFVDDNDIFPEEFRSFLWPAGPLRQIFETHHPDLFTVTFWRDLQARHRAGEQVDLFPYLPRRRLSAL